jgi:sodium-dependent phosphate transporter
VASPSASPPSTAVLRRKNSYKLSLWMLPLFTFITVWIGCYYIIQKVG